MKNPITLYNISITSNSEAGQFIHNQYAWIDGSFTSPLHSNLVSFTTSANNPIVSQYQTVTGGLVALISAASTASPIVNNANQYYASFTMPAGTTTENNLYLIWDYRQSTAASLNKDTTATLACAGSTAPVANCNTQLSYSGGEAFPSEYNITLGSTTGVVTLTFDAQDIPDKFIVEYDGSEVINTGYRGSTIYQGDLNSALALKGLPAETITAPGNGTATFTKSTATTTATLKVYSPLSSTVWTATLSCPV